MLQLFQIFFITLFKIFLTFTFKMPQRVSKCKTLKKVFFPGSLLVNRAIDKKSFQARKSTREKTTMIAVSWGTECFMRS